MISIKLCIAQDSCWSILQAEDKRNGELFVTYYVGLAFPGTHFTDVFHRHSDSTKMSPDSKVCGANVRPTWGRQDPGGPHVGPMILAIWVVLLSPQFKKMVAPNFAHATCRGTDMPCAKRCSDQVIKNMNTSKYIFHRIWITGKTVSEMKPLPLFVVRYGIIHIYTRYNLALKAAESFKSEMSSLLFENACQSGLSKAKSKEAFRDRDVFVVHFVVVFRLQYAIIFHSTF